MPTRNGSGANSLQSDLSSKLRTKADRLRQKAEEAELSAKAEDERVSKTPKNILKSVTVSIGGTDGYGGPRMVVSIGDEYLKDTSVTNFDGGFKRSSFGGYFDSLSDFSKQRMVEKVSEYKGVDEKTAKEVVDGIEDMVRKRVLGVDYKPFEEKLKDPKVQAEIMKDFSEYAEKAKSYKAKIEKQFSRNDYDGDGQITGAALSQELDEHTSDLIKIRKIVSDIYENGGVDKKTARFVKSLVDGPMDKAVKANPDIFTN